MRFLLLPLLLIPISTLAQVDMPASKIERNVVYGMYSGLALLMDVYYPESPNGLGIIHVSGSGFTRPLSLDAKPINQSSHVKLEGAALVEAGYTLFSVNHRAIPRFRYPAAVEDVQRAVRYIRHHADRFGIDPHHIGAIGGSSGGHLVSMLGVMDGKGDFSDGSPINRKSAKVQAVIARATPTNFLEGMDGSAFLGVRVKESSNKRTEEYRMAKAASPITHVSPDDPPFLLMHGDKDEIVPYAQSESFAQKLTASHVPVELLTIKGAGHGPAFKGAIDPPDLDKARVAWMDKHLKSKRVTSHQEILYRTTAERDLKLDIYVPKEGQNPPLVVWIHGGAWRAGNKHHPIAYPLLTDHGFAVASIQYRFSQEAIWPAQIQDCKAAIRWLRAHAGDYGYDASRIGVWGSSAGGHLVAMLGTAGDQKEWEVGDHLDQSSKVQAVCNWFGPTNFLLMDEHAIPGGRLVHDAANSPESQLIGGLIQENKKASLKADPTSYVSKGDPPMLLMHGDQDKLVPFHQSEWLYAALQKAKVPSRLERIYGAGHGGRKFNTYDNLQMVLAFFQEKIGQ
ncbi:MAG: alpha/beta hydrolase [Bacteroidota bacterium]